MTEIAQKMLNETNQRLLESFEGKLFGSLDSEELADELSYDLNKILRDRLFIAYENIEKVRINRVNGNDKCSYVYQQENIAREKRLLLDYVVALLDVDMEPEFEEPTVNNEVI